MKPKLLLCLALVLSGGWFGCSTNVSQGNSDVSVAKGVNPQFTVSILGQKQYNQSQYDKGGLPIVICPKVASTLSTSTFDQPSENCFFVVIQNTQKVADGIAMCLSEWYDCLQFKIIDALGKTYSVSPAPMDWSANILENWTFPIGGMRVMAVDFTSAAMVGQCPGWQGLPPVPSAPELVTMTATFRYYDPTGKPINVSSKPTAVYLFPK